MKKFKNIISGLTAIAISLSTLLPAMNTIKATEKLTVKKVYGDLNEDGKINILDLMHLKKIILSGDNDNKLLKFADVDGNGEISIKDINEMTKYLMTEIEIFEPELALDSDNDGLCDYIEQLLGTDKIKPDTDNDGLSDYEEVFSTYTNPLNQFSFGNETSDNLFDNDNDGISNIDEIKYNTNPNNADTDNDKITDIDEIELGSDPLKIDTDDDNISDYGESKLGTNPSKQSTDGSILDNKLYFDQNLDEEYLYDINTFDNCYSLKVSANMTGYIGDELIVKESSCSTFLSNNSIFGRILDISYSKDYENNFDTSEFNYTLSFSLDETFEPNEYMIFYYAEDDFILVPFETNINENVLSVSYNKPATFCLVNISDSSDTFDNEIIDTTLDEEPSIGSINNGIAYQVTTGPKNITNISYYFEVDNFNIKGWHSNPELREALIDSTAQLQTYDDSTLNINMIFYGEAHDSYFGHGYYKVTINCRSASDISDVFNRADEFFAQNVTDSRKASTIYDEIKKHSNRSEAYQLSVSTSTMAPNLKDATTLSFCIGSISGKYSMRIGFMNLKIGGPNIDNYKVCIRSNLRTADKIITLARNQKNKVYVKSPFLGYTYIEPSMSESLRDYFSNKGINSSISNKISNKYREVPTIYDVISKNSKTQNGTSQYAQKTNTDMNTIEMCYYIPWTSNPGTDDSDGDGLEDYRDGDPIRSFDKRFCISPVSPEMLPVTENQTAMISEKHKSDIIYNNEKPTSDDYLTKAKAEAIVVGSSAVTVFTSTATLFAGSIIHVANSHLQHYLSGSGDTYYNVPSSYIDDTFHGPLTISDNLNLVRNICEETVVDNACFNSKEDTNLVMCDLTSDNCGMNTIQEEIDEFSKNPVSDFYNKIHTELTTRDYYYGIGSCGGTMNFRCTRIDENKFTATVNMYMLDFYNFTNGTSQVLPIDDLLTDGDMYRLHRCGLAKDYIYVGKLTFIMTWTQGERINKDYDGVKQVRSYLVKEQLVS